MTFAGKNSIKEEETDHSQVLPDIGNSRNMDAFRIADHTPDETYLRDTTPMSGSSHGVMIQLPKAKRNSKKRHTIV